MGLMRRKGRFIGSPRSDEQGSRASSWTSRGVDPQVRHWGRRASSRMLRCIDPQIRCLEASSLDVDVVGASRPNVDIEGMSTLKFDLGAIEPQVGRRPLSSTLGVVEP
ncbi:hypothetical protein CRG98_040372 [Punica granatum]|uniref:Uncharacterized protein n=1 Tax=Punica granatum TaxID=22663 RepID=A0A2I0I608_PUNGR|nr:hypothetical protein CRG98_040372 [Punica granatum]